MKFLYLIVREDGWVRDYAFSESDAYKLCKEYNAVEDYEFRVVIFPVNDHIIDDIAANIHKIEL